MILNELLAERGVLLADGATGTNFFARGLETGYPPELWSVEESDKVSELHRQFLEAGSDIILTNSFGGTSYRLKLHNAQDRVVELNQAAAQLARGAADAHQSKTGKRVIVAGSMGPSGELFTPLGALDHASAFAAFKQQADALASGGVDILWIETMSSLEEVDAAFDAASQTGLPVVATMTFDTAGKSMMGVEPADYANHVGGRGAAAVGANCGIGPAELISSVLAMKLSQLSGGKKLPLVAKGNCGIPEYRGGEIHYHGSPELMAQYAAIARDIGVSIIGGCCGTTLVHIEAMRRALDTPMAKDGISLADIDKILGVAWPNRSDAGGDDARPNRSRRRRGG